MRAWLLGGLAVLVCGCGSTQSHKHAQNQSDTRSTPPAAQLANQALQTETTYVPYTIYVPYTRTVAGPTSAPILTQSAVPQQSITQPMFTQPTISPNSNVVPPISGAIPIAPMPPQTEPARPIAPRDISVPIPSNNGTPAHQTVYTPIAPTLVPLPLR